jgi:L-asparaginase II
VSSRISGPPYIEVVRGAAVESVHDVAACAVGPEELPIFALGDNHVPIYLRSAAKPFIAAAAVMAGVMEHFDLTQRELAVMVGSHEAEGFHLEAVRSILTKIGLEESALQCGPETPLTDPICNNCSGKHAGVLALALAIGADPATYRDPRNQAQQLILDFCAAISGQPRSTMQIAVDGCGIPVYATPLYNAALAYHRLATLDVRSSAAAQALRRVRDAMIAYPEYMSGTGEFDAEVIRAFDGALVCKGGAEGVWGVAHIDRGIGLVIKVVDGNSRARPPAGLAAMRSIGLLDETQREQLRGFAEPLVYNKAGSVVGVIRPIENGVA